MGRCSAGLSSAAVSGGHSLVSGHRLLIAVASLVAGHRLYVGGLQYLPYKDLGFVVPPL